MLNQNYHGKISEKLSVQNLLRRTIQDDENLRFNKSVLALLENVGKVINLEVQELNLSPSTYFASLKYLERYVVKLP